ncbi:unnamed protein product, partial [Rotaria sp. Silwood2]
QIRKNKIRLFDDYDSGQDGVEVIEHNNKMKQTDIIDGLLRVTFQLELPM